MKSIIEEASSIVKAVEKGWTQAGKPNEFSVKIFEEPEKNFFGITIKSAKIGIFFNDEQPKAQETKKFKQPKPKSQKDKNDKKAQNQAKKIEETKKNQPEKPKEFKKIKEPREIRDVKEESKKPKSEGPIWKEDMIQNVSKWLKEIFQLMDKHDIQFSTNPENFSLKIKLDKPVFDDKNRQKQLFITLSIIMMQMLKKHYKRPLKGYKIIINS